MDKRERKALLDKQNEIKEEHCDSCKKQTAADRNRALTGPCGPCKHGMALREIGDRLTGSIRQKRESRKGAGSMVHKAENCKPASKVATINTTKKAATVGAADHKEKEVKPSKVISMTKYNELENEHERLYKKYRELQEQHENLEKSHREMALKVKNYEETPDRMEEHVNKLRARVTDLELDLQHRDEQLMNKNDDMIQLASTLETVTEQRDELEKKCKEFEDGYQMMQGELQKIAFRHRALSVALKAELQG